MARPRSDEVARRLFILKCEVVQVFATPPKRAYEGWPDSDKERLRKGLQQRTNEICEMFQRLELWEFLADSEVKFFSTNPLDLTQQQFVTALWRMESVMTFMWALRMIPELLPFDRQAEGDMMKQIPHQDVCDFFSRIKLLDESSIEAKRALAELWHWRSRTRELVEKGVKPNILGERSVDDVVRTTATVAHSRRDVPQIVDEDFGVHGKAYRDLSDEEWSSVRSIAYERHFALNWLCGYAPGNDWDETPTDT
jgi:hypothetical protein